MALDTSAVNNKDAFTDSAAPSTNYGTGGATFVNANTNEKSRMYISFTLPTGSGEITSIKLFLYRSGGAHASNYSGNYNLYYSADNTWTEGGLTWNNQPATTGSILDGVPYTGSNGWLSWTISSPTVTWGDALALVVKTDENAADTDYMNFNTKEAASNKPYLEITYLDTSVKTVNGLAKASVKTKNGLAIASVKTMNSLA